MKHQACIKTVDGAPRLMIDGQLTPPVLYCLSDFPAAKSNTAQAQKNIRQFAEAGILPVCADVDLALCWHKVSPPDFEPIQAEIAGVLDANPDAPVLLRLHLNPPYWWLRDHPEEQLIYIDHPGFDDGERRRMIQDDGKQPMRVSLASERWLREAGELLEKMCLRLQQTEEGESLVGIQVACGLNGEWHQWGADCSAPMRRRFRKMLQEEYGSDEALQKAWGRPDVTIASAPFQPDPAQAGDDGCFRHPVRSRHIIDAQRCIQLVPPEDILHFCRIIRRAWPGMMTGTFYGYLLNSMGMDSPVMGHLDPMTLLTSPDIDYLSGPFPYMKNRHAAGVPLSRGLLESCRLHGKLWLTEMDQHPVGCDRIPGGDPELRPETIAQMRRNFLLPLLSGQGLWYYDHRIVPGVTKLDTRDSLVGSIWRKRGWWDHPELMAEIGALQRIAAENGEGPYEPAGDVLCVLDTKALYCTRGQPFSEYPVLHVLLRCAVTADFIYLEDLPVCDLSRYRAVLFLNLFSLTAEQTDSILTLTRGKQRVWLWAPGYSDGSTLSAEGISRATGMRVVRIPSVSYTQMLDGLPESPETVRALEPSFAIDQEDAEPLVKDDQGRVLAARRGDDWYFARPVILPEQMLAALDAAKTHRYTEEPACVFADGRFLFINTASGGLFHVTLKNGVRTVLSLEGNTTAVLDAKTGERIL